MKLVWLLKDWIEEEEEKTGTQIKEASPGWVGVGVVENVWRLEEVGLPVRVVGCWWCRCRCRCRWVLLLERWAGDWQTGCMAGK